jgi:hypothetical protein
MANAYHPLVHKMKSRRVSEIRDSTVLIYQYMEKVPIHPIDFSDPADKARHDKMVELVDRMLELNKQKHSGKLAPSQVERIAREIATSDAALDELVYELYGITKKKER